MRKKAVETRGAAVLAPASCGLALLITTASAVAQTQLPGIVVTTPSPIVRQAPPPVRQASQSAAAQPQQQASAPGPSQPAVPDLVPGAFIVADDTFVPVTVVTGGEALSAPGAASIADVLQNKPGIASSGFAPGANQPVIRGLDSYRVRVQENGVSTHDVSALSPDHAVPVDPFAAERVEVVRGPATLRYGSQAIGGVVAIENNRIPSEIPANGVSAEVKGGLNSADRGKDGGFQVTAGAGHFAIHADAFTRRASDYDTPHGRQLNSFVESKGFSLGTSYIWSSGFMGISFTRYESLYGIPGEEAAEERPRIDLAQDKWQSKGEWRVRDWGIEAIRYWMGATRYAHNEVIFEEADAQDIIGTRFTKREVEGRVEVQHLPVGTALGELRGAAGIHTGRKRVAGFPVDEPVDGLIDPAAHQRYLAGFILEELQVAPRLRLQAAARLELNTAEGTGVDDPLGAANVIEASRSYRPLSGSVGALYELPLGIVARVTGQHTERAPDAAELFSKGVHEATGTFEIGDPGLRLETARTVEFGLKRSRGSLRFDASVYHTSYEGFIFKSFTGRQCDETLASCGGGSELDEAVFTQRDARFTGAELAAQLDIGRVWNGIWGIEGQYDFVRAAFDDGVNVPRIPPHRIGGGLYYRATDWRARVYMLHAFDQNAISIIDPKDTPTSGYTLLNAEIARTWQLERSGALVPELTVGLRGENLLDDDVRNHVSPSKDEVLQPGRTIRLFGSVKLN
jgi:iron complex outermembrane recepter protein